MDTTIITVGNQKGGVSKTGVSFNLGSALALKHDKRVLLVDLDPRANLSEYLKYEPDGKPTLTQLVMTACTGGCLPLSLSAWLSVTTIPQAWTTFRPT